MKKGFEQITERLLNSENQLNDNEILKLFAKMYQNKVSAEFGNSSYKSKEIIEKLGFKFLPNIYDVYDLNYYLDCSHSGVELEFKFKTYLTSIYNVLTLIEELKLYNKLYEKGIILIEGFNITPSTEKRYSIRNNFPLEYKSYNELQGFSNFGVLEPITKNYKNS